MPGIGIPQDIKSKNQFKNVKMAPKPITLQQELSAGEQLNKLAGNKSSAGKSLYVDGKKHNKLGKDEFLKLLSHQLQHQDPMNPMEQNKFAAELAQFSQLEQMTNMNTSLNKMQGNAPTENKFYAASFLGKEVITNGTSLKLQQEGDRPEASFELMNNAANVMVRIFDKNNQMVQQLDLKAMPKGTQTITWDGKTMDGGTAGKGDYRIQVFAYDINATPVETKTKGIGRVIGVNFQNGETVLTLEGNKKVFLRDVDSFKLPKSERKPQEKAVSKPMNAVQNKPAFNPNTNSAKVYSNEKQY